MSRRSLYLAWVLFPLLLALESWALDPRTPLQHYSALTWRVSDGLAFSWVSGFAQTPDGYIWIATQYGLNRFDGVRFTAYNSSNTPAFRVNVLTSVTVDRRGALWIGTWGGGVVVREGGRFRVYESELSSPRVRSILEAEADDIWIGTANGISRLQHGRWSHINVNDGLPGSTVTCLLLDRNRHLWAGTVEGGLGRFDGKTWTSFGLAQGLPSLGITALLEDHAGKIWVATAAGIGSLEDGVWRGLSPDRTMSLFEDRDQAIWAGTEGSGLSRYQNGKRETLSRPGLRSIRQFFEDREGNLWIATGGDGVTRLSDSPFTVLRAQQGLASDSVVALLREPAGRLLIGTQDALQVISDEKALSPPYAALLPGEDVQCLYRDSTGVIWIGTGKSMLRRLVGNRIEVFTTRTPLEGEVTAMLEDGTGCFLLGQARGISRLCGHELSTFPDLNLRDKVTFLTRDRSGAILVGTFGSGLFMFPAKGPAVLQKDISDKVILCHSEDDDGTLWIGTGASGLYRRKAGRWSRIGEDRGLFDNTVIGMVDDGAGVLWISSKRGIFRVDKSEANDVIEGRRDRLSRGNFGRSAGLGDGHCFAQSSPKAIRTPDGRLWFATTDGLVIVDSNHSRTNMKEPLVNIEEVRVEGSAVAAPGPGEPVPVRAGSRRIEFLFTAPTFREPEGVRFSYLLEGFDTDWLTSGADRRAQYMNVPPGDYRFRVRAVNENGMRSGKDATLPITVAPLFWQTKLFYALLAAGLVGLGFAVQRLRVLRLKAQRVALQRLVAERTQELSSANEALHGAQQKIAQLLQSTPKASESLPMWSRTVSEEIAATLGAAAIAIWEVEGDQLLPLWDTLVPPPDLRLVQTSLGGESTPLVATEEGFVVPLLGISGDLCGALSINGRALQWGSTERQLVVSFARQIGGALEMTKLRRKLAAAEERRISTRREMQEQGIATLQICPVCGRCFDHLTSRCETDGSPLESPRPLAYRLMDRYRFVQLLGQGGMGVVLAAHDEKLGREVAIKLIRPEHFGQHEIRERFEREARMVARIQHPGVIALLDSGELPDGSAFLVMEKLTGHSLGSLIKDFGGGTPQQVAVLLRQAAAALAAAHRAGVVHRDVKPENVFLVSEQPGFRVKLLDFGLAKSMSAEKGLTQTGMIVGTPQYMSPEQVRGQEVDAQSDLYSLAAVSYEALTGREVIPAKQIGDIMVGVLTAAPRAVSELVPGAPPEVDLAFAAALAKDPAKRPANMESWAAELASALEKMPAMVGAGWPLATALSVEGGRASKASGASPTRAVEV